MGGLLLEEEAEMRIQPLVRPLGLGGIIVCTFMLEAVVDKAAEAVKGLMLALAPVDILPPRAVVPVVMVIESEALDLLAEDPADTVVAEAEQQLAPSRTIAEEATPGL